MPEAFFCGECGSSTRPRRNVANVERTDTRVLPSETPPDAPNRETWKPRFADEFPVRLPESSSSISNDEKSAEPPRFLSEEAPTAEFTLTFSNGDAITVAASGILGRNPVAGPGEVYEHLIIVTDPDRTVSKTHLEFGIEDSEFWVCDRYSGNGTVIHESHKPARRLVPGRRYRVVRGATVGIGEQSFQVS